MINKKSGGNGDVEIDYDKKTATKTLKSDPKPESVTRYKREIEALKRISSLGINNVVEIKGFDEEKNKIKIIMKLYDGDLSALFPETKGNPILSCAWLRQIVLALKQLSELEIPIFHRDLKPANILYSRENDVQLFLADFGCCYFEQDDNRTTPAFWAVGAQNYRAPEYDYGKVENVNEKGDIYSIGKILWAMVNGVKHDIFPYTLWFPKEYNLSNRFGNQSEILQANLIIARCVSIDPSNRPTYDELLIMLDNINDKALSPSQEKMLKAKMFSAQREIESEEIRQFNYHMLNIFYLDFYDVISETMKDYPDLLMIGRIYEIFLGAFDRKDYHIKTKVEGAQTSYIFSGACDNIYFDFKYNPTYSVKNGTIDDKYANISGSYTIYSKSNGESFSIRYINSLLHIEYKDEIVLYSKTIIRKYVEDMIDNYMNSFE